MKKVEFHGEVIDLPQKVYLAEMKGLYGWVSLSGWWYGECPKWPDVTNTYEYTNLDAVWHGKNELPKSGAFILFEGEYGTYTGFYDTLHGCDIVSYGDGFDSWGTVKRWAYVDDLMPTKGGER